MKNHIYYITLRDTQGRKYMTTDNLEAWRFATMYRGSMHSEPYTGPAIPNVTLA